MVWQQPDWIVSKLQDEPALSLMASGIVHISLSQSAEPGSVCACTLNCMHMPAGDAEEKAAQDAATKGDDGETLTLDQYEKDHGPV